MAQPADDWIVPAETGATAPAHAPGDDWIVPDADKPSGLQRARDALTPAPMQRVETAIGRGMVEGFGNEPVGLSPQHEAELQQLGLLHRPGQPFEITQAVTDFAIRRGAQAADVFFRALGAGAHGVATGAGQIAREAGQNEAQATRLSGDIETAEDLALMSHIPERDLIAGAAPAARTATAASSPAEIEAFLGRVRGMRGREEIDDFIRQKDAGEDVGEGPVAQQRAQAPRTVQPPPDDWVVPQETAAAPEPPAPAPAGAAIDTAFPSLEEPERTAPPPVAEIPTAAPPPEPPVRTDVGPHVLQALLDDPRSAAEIRGQIDARKAAAVDQGQAPIQAGIAPQPLAQVPDQTPVINQVSHETPPAPVGTRELPVALEAPEHVLAGAEHTAEPTPGQAEAGNYQKRHLRWKGLNISVETEAGQERSGIGPDGQPWSVTLTSPYGYIKGTKGRDGEQVDVYLGPEPQSPHVFIVDQIDPATGRFDEHKALIGFPDEASARAAYRQAFSDDSAESRLGALQSLTVEGFKDWLGKGQRRQPLAYSDPVRAAEGIAREIGLNATAAEVEEAARAPGAKRKVSGADLPDTRVLTDALVSIIERNAIAEEAESADSIQRQEVPDGRQVEPTATNAARAEPAPAGEPTERAGAQETGEAAAGVELGEAERDRSAEPTERVEPQAPVTRDAAPAEPEITPLGTTAATLTEIIPKIEKMSADARADVRERVAAMMTDMAAEGRKIAEHCVETGGKFSVRRR